MIFDPDKTIILIIDIQDKLLNAAFNSLSIKKNSETLIKTARALNIPIFITEQYPKGLGETIKEIKNNLESTNCTVFEKNAFNAFSDKNIWSTFKKLNRKQVIICGIETHICVYQTAEYLLNKEYSVTVISDSSGSRNDIEHNLGLDNIKQDGGYIKTTEMILFELLKTSKHPKFKELQTLIK